MQLSTSTYLNQYNDPVAEDMKKNIYVDDLIAGVQHDEEAATYYNQARAYEVEKVGPRVGDDHVHSDSSAVLPIEQRVAKCCEATFFRRCEHQGLWNCCLS